MSKAADKILAGLNEALAFARGDADVRRRSRVTRVKVADVDVKAVRGKLGLSQKTFAQAFGVSAKTVQNWEQGRRQPEGPARVLLRVIERHPDAVLESLAPKRRKRA